MAKYHIGKDGVQRVCYAKSKPCPLGVFVQQLKKLTKVEKSDIIYINKKTERK